MWILLCQQLKLPLSHRSKSVKTTEGLETSLFGHTASVTENKIQTTPLLFTHT